MDSFSERSNFPQLGWKYNQVNIGQTVVAGYQVRTAPAGQAWADADQGSHAIEYARVVQSMPHWVVGIRVTATLDGATQCVFLRFTSAQTSELDNDLANASTQFSAAYLTDGTLAFYGGGDGTELNPGTLIFSGGAKLISGQQTYLEFDISFSSTGSGILTVMRDDALFFTSSGLTIGATFPDRAAFRKNRGFYGTALLTFQDFYIADTLQGPVKITGWTMNGDSIPQGFARAGSVVHPANYQQINERLAAVGSTDVPDGDTTYVYNDSAAAVTDLYRPSSIACYGKILAVALNITCRLITGTPNIQVLVRQAATRYNLGSLTPVPLGSILFSFGHGQTTPGTGDALYGQLQNVSTTQPNGAGDWDDQSIANADWGMLSDTLGIFRATALTLEKMVSLRTVPYNCPGGDYSF